MHLVPFGEYFPLKIITAPISRYFFGDAKDFSRGKVHKVFNSNNINILPLICYESAFYDIIFNAFKDKSPDMLVILSNDSWFGETLGRTQHFAIDIVRAKEFMRPVIRVTQSGISAYINEKGEIINKIGNNKQDIIEANVNIDSNKRSLFSKYGYLWLGIYALISLIFSVKRERY
jgi:apolipoprotein N-acyltransferase